MKQYRITTKVVTYHVTEDVEEAFEILCNSIDEAKKNGFKFSHTVNGEYLLTNDNENQSIIIKITNEGN